MYKSLQTTHDTQRRTKTDSNRSSESLNLFSIQDFKNYNTYVHTFLKSQKNKRPMCHIAHLRQFKSLNKYDYIITLIKRRKNFMGNYWFFIWRNLNPLHPRMLCAKFGWNWLKGSGEEIFKFLQCILAISEWSPLPSFEQTWIPFTQGCFVPSLVKIGSVVLERKIF